MEPVLDNDSRNSLNSPTVSKNSADNSLEVRANADRPLSNSSSSSGYPNQSFGSRDEAEGFDLQRVLAIILRRWPVMLSVFLVATALGVFTIIRSKPIYQATATIELTPSQQNSAGAGIQGMQQFMGSQGPDMVETQLANLRGPEVYSRAIAKMTPADRQVLSKMATVNAAQNGVTRLVSVSVQSYDAKAAAKFANALCEEFIKVSLEKNQANSLGGVAYVEEQLSEVRDRLAQSNSQLKDFKKQTGIFNIGETATSLGEKSSALQKELEEAYTERASVQSKLNGLQSSLSRLPAGRVVAAGVQRNPEVGRIQARLTQLEFDRTVALKDYRPTSRKVRSIDVQMQTLRGQLQREAQTIVSAWQPDPARAPLAADAAASQAQLWSLDARISALKGQSSRANANLSQLPDQEFKFTQLATDTQVLQSTYQLLSERLQGLKIGAAARVADARMAGKAQPSDVPVAPNKTRVLIYTMGVGLLAALGIGLLLDLMDNHIYSEDDVQSVTGLPVLAQIPLFREEQEINLLHAHQAVAGKSSPLLETFRMLRTNIRLSVIDKNVRSIVITSSMPSEGKSHTALNLAVAAASSGDRVILVDLDLRRPSTHRICDLPNIVGFTSVLSNQCSLEDALQDTIVPGLRVLTSGPVPPNPFRLLNSQAARALVERLEEEADLVVIDTPPMLTMADALLVSSWVDGTLLVISSSEMKKRDVSRSVDLLFQNNNEVLGTILTKVSSNVDGYYSYYGYKKYNHYFESDEAVAFDGEKSLPANGQTKGK
jgi:capsular exopolysaccharide synthesis family protein